MKIKFWKSKMLETPQNKKAVYTKSNTKFALKMGWGKKITKGRVKKTANH